MTPTVVIAVGALPNTQQTTKEENRRSFMDRVWFLAALWLFLALVAVLLANWLRISTALSEIVVGTVAQLATGAFMGSEALGAKAPWIAFLAGTGAIVLTFLGSAAGLRRAVFRQDAIQAMRAVSHRPRIWVRPKGRHLLLADDVHGADIRNDIGAVRVEPRRHRPDAILSPGCHRHRERSDTNRHRERVVHAVAPAA
jgi:hypothetical protein